MTADAPRATVHAGITTADSYRAEWIGPPPLPAPLPVFVGHRLIDALLHARGIETATQASTFLHPQDQLFADPWLMPDMDRAVRLIREAAASGACVAVFGDYDVDGLTSTAMLVRVLRRLGIDTIPIVPHRVHDGYGVNPVSVRRIIDCNATLVISVDCGSSSAAEFQQLLGLGRQAIVLDHHAYSGELPPEVAFVSPRRPDSRYPCTELAAVGVAFSLVRALLGGEAAAMYLPYVAIGSVADVVDLRGENRALVAQGIAKLRRWMLPGFRALCAATGLDQSAVGTWELGFIIGPRLNAAGRVDSPQVALDLLLADDATTATPLAHRLCELNELRQVETRRMQDEAETMLAAQGGSSHLPALVLASESWRAGIAGLVAARLAETHGRPTIVLEQGTTVSRGSARTAGGVNIVEAISASAHLLERFGGHAAAAGLTVPNEHLETFRHELAATIFDLCGGRLPAPQYQIDAQASHDDLELDTVDWLRILEPFGPGNPIPTILVRGLRHRYAKHSRDGKHLLANLVDSYRRSHSAVYFGNGGRLPELHASPVIDVITNFTRDTWQGRNRLKLQIVDFRAASR
jgi:single-stranded-DNA-specific exonuclease